MIKIYRAKISFKISRYGAPPDKATFETEFCLEPKSLHKGDDQDMVALAAAYAWVKSTQEYLYTDTARPDLISFDLHDKKPLFKWHMNDKIKLDDFIKEALHAEADEADEVVA